MEPLTLIFIGALLVLITRQRTGMSQSVTQAIAGVLTGVLILMALVV